MNVHEYMEKYINEVKSLLLTKNESYGNSALSPISIFSSEHNYTQIKVRIDDKLSRLHNKKIITDTEDTVMDLIGYLLLYDMAVSTSLHNQDINFSSLLDNTVATFSSYLASYKESDYNDVYFNIAFPAIDTSDKKDMLLLIRYNFAMHLKEIAEEGCGSKYNKLVMDLILIEYYERRIKGEI